MQDIRSYEENDDPIYDEHGSVLSVYLYNGDGFNILSTFAEFKRKHDEYIEYENNKFKFLNRETKDN